ncbi:MAG: beta-ACP synthase [Rhodospirillaceae bacterium]|nr:beta-ACP synthase [Rhodospirillaceae bacterium]|tara:strand:- start:8765 stop:10000 length:1236 start_codon:yes stop_codon:yes gene_type:complete
MRQVVITGIGVVTSVGNTKDEFWHCLVEGESGVGNIEQFDTEKLNIKVGAEVKNFHGSDHFSKSQYSLLDRFSQFAVVAAREAVSDSGVTISDEISLKTAVIIGTGAGGQNTQDDNYRKIYSEGTRRLHPFTIPRLMINSAVSHVTMDLGIRGPAYAIASACASGSHAIGQALNLIRSGVTEIALTGGTEACITFGTMKGWEALRVMAPDTCNPFSADRRGMVLGEGAAMFVLESLENAQARGAKIYAELAGVGMSADASNIVEPSVDGAARAINEALREAGLEPEDIDYVNAHGTATKLNDITETMALHKSLGESAKKVSVSSTKSMHGHALGAAGAIECAVTALAVFYGIVPPTINFTEPDKECDLDYTPNTARKTKIRAAISNSFAFGGLNAVLALRKVKKGSKNNIN